MREQLRLPEIDPHWTPRQQEVLNLLVRGYTNGEIAEQLGVGLEGAKFHVSEILSKLQVQSREEAAEYWRYRNGLRMRFSRIGGGIFGGADLKWVAAGTAVIAAGAVAALILVGLLGGDDEEPQAGDPGTATATPGASGTATTPDASATAATPTTDASSTPAPVLTPFPEVSTVARESVSRGATITGGYGLVFGNPNTGGVEVWLLPQYLAPAGVSPGGRYFVFESELIDAWTGTRTTLAIEGEVRLASFAPDDSAVVVHSDKEAALFRNDGHRLAGFAAIAGELGAEAVWSSDSRGVALRRYNATTSRTEVLIDGIEREIASDGMADWAQSGLRLAVTGNNPAIYDFDSGSRVPLERSGTFPSWSPDDGFLAVDISTDGQAATSVIDPSNGREILRLYNLGACLNIGWVTTNALPGGPESMVEIPSGELVPYAASTTPAARLPRIAISQSGLVEWQFPGGTTAAVRVEATWAYTFAWVRRDAAGGRFPPVLFLGRGGQDACGGSPLDAVVARPPFSPAQVPTPTPTPDK
ncbi:MAG: LuxR C-terminal-related transcriptional regulator [Dehalococcoidia bacterium]